jgi:hypothetical protein
MDSSVLTLRRLPWMKRHSVSGDANHDIVPVVTVAIEATVRTSTASLYYTVEER